MDIYGFFALEAFNNYNMWLCFNSHLCRHILLCIILSVPIDLSTFMSFIISSDPLSMDIVLSSIIQTTNIHVELTFTPPIPIGLSFVQKYMKL